MRSNGRILGLGVVAVAMLRVLHRARVGSDRLCPNHGLTPTESTQRFLNIEDVH
jgi:hypothetical protein